MSIPVPQFAIRSVNCDTYTVCTMMSACTASRLPSNSTWRIIDKPCFKIFVFYLTDLNYPPTLPSMFCKYTTDHKLMLSWDKPHMAEKCCELYNISINRSKNATNTITMENSVTLVIKSEVINASVHCWNSNTETLGPGVDIAIDTGIKLST